MVIGSKTRAPTPPPLVERLPRTSPDRVGPSSVRGAQVRKHQEAPDAQRQQKDTFRQGWRHLRLRAGLNRSRE